MKVIVLFMVRSQKEWMLALLCTFHEMAHSCFFSGIQTGRQFPLKGRFMANVFIHFEPIGPIGGQVNVAGDLPPYVIPGSPSESIWRQQNPKGHRVMGKHGTFTTGSTELHHHVLEGRIEDLKNTLDKHAHLVNVRDKNGWTALHEAARKGEIEAITLLLDRGAEVNARTGVSGEGVSPLNLAKQYHGSDHPVAQLLEARGGKDYQRSEL